MRSAPLTTTTGCPDCEAPDAKRTVTSASLGSNSVIARWMAAAIASRSAPDCTERAEKSGTVKSVNAKAGESLAVDAIILEME